MRTGAPFSLLPSPFSLLTAHVHHTSALTLSGRTIGSPALQPNAFRNSGMFANGPFTLRLYGECTSAVASRRVYSGRCLLRQTWAQPRKNRWGPVRPSIGGGSLPLSERI